MNKNDENLHTGHRKRIRERFFASSGEGMPDHELLEVLLFSVIGRKNTNPLAHELISSFGSLAGVFDAPIEELLKIEGIGEKTAYLIKELPIIWKRYELSKSERPLLDTLERIGGYVVPLFRDAVEEKVILLMLDSSKRLISSRLLAKGSASSGDINPRTVAEIALANKASSVLLAHNHPNGELLPSDSDISTTLLIRRAFALIDLVLCEHIIVAGENYYPIMAELSSDKRKASIDSEKLEIVQLN